MNFLAPAFVLQSPASDLSLRLGQLGSHAPLASDGPWARMVHIDFLLFVHPSPRGVQCLFSSRVTPTISRRAPPGNLRLISSGRELISPCLGRIKLSLALCVAFFLPSFAIIRTFVGHLFFFANLRNFVGQSLGLRWSSFSHSFGPSLDLR